jgi:hypothetical protein
VLGSLVVFLTVKSYGYNVTPQTNVYRCVNNLPNRRSIVLTSLLGIFPTLITNSSPSNGLSQEEDKESYSPHPLLQLRITVQPGTEWVERTNSALYITARPNSIHNIPPSILEQSQGKPPPVLSARLPFVQSIKDLPMIVTLTTNDITPEGRMISDPANDYWWQPSQGDNNDSILIISARLDTDGIAATRDPNDLVGRALWVSGTHDSVLTLPLQGRGIAGKFFTSQR